MEYILKRSKRKTAAIYVRNGFVEVRAPIKMPKKAIDTFVASKEQWIKDRLAKTQEQSAKRDAFGLFYGDPILYRGKKYPLAPRTGSHAGFDENAFFMPPDLPPEYIKSTCIQIYRMLAKRYLTEKTLQFARLMGLAPSNIKITGAKTRWGSCSAKKNINYAWRLIMAEDDVIDYVVVHELAHLKELNHSPRFWSIVERVLPDYRDRKLKLRTLQKQLATENWDE